MGKRAGTAQRCARPRRAGRGQCSEFSIILTHIRAALFGYCALSSDSHAVLSFLCGNLESLALSTSDFPFFDDITPAHAARRRREPER